MSGIRPCLFYFSAALWKKFHQLRILSHTKELEMRESTTENDTEHVAHFRMQELKGYQVIIIVVVFVVFVVVVFVVVIVIVVSGLALFI